ncbi:ABC transporter permease, partial [Okeania sp. SIO2C2]|uniref:ABC transporter permease n=1 Tax=Okeania sp. SIO2C2 TaxID=2607787 RepID=UPI0035C8F371
MVQEVDKLSVGLRCRLTQPTIYYKMKQKILKSILLPIFAVFAALLTGAALMLLAKTNPVTAYTALFQESLTTYFGFSDTLSKTTPLLLASLGILIALRAGLFNLGGEGQIYMGALGSVVVGLYLPNLPIWIHLPLALTGGFLLGAIWGAIAGYLKVARGLNEVLT